MTEEKKKECGNCDAEEGEYHADWCCSKPNFRVGSKLEDEAFGWSETDFRSIVEKAADGDAIPIPPKIIGKNCPICGVAEGEYHDECCPAHGAKNKSNIDIEPLSSVRTFNSGATRHVDYEKYDYEGFLSPRAIRRYGEYMHAHRVQADGIERDSDNWQKGIPISQYMKSHYRHTQDTHAIYRGVPTFDTKDGSEVNIENALCGVIFNAFGHLHEILKKRDYK